MTSVGITLLKAGPWKPTAPQRAIHTCQKYAQWKGLKTEIAASNPPAPPVPHATQFFMEPTFKADQPLTAGHNPPMLRSVQRVQGLKIATDGQDIASPSKISVPSNRLSPVPP